MERSIKFSTKLAMTILFSKRAIKRIFFCIFIVTLFLNTSGIAQEIPTHRVLKTEKLAAFLKDDVNAKIQNNKKITQNLLASYLREKFAERYFYDWKTFDDRFNSYNQIYGNESNHNSRAKDHMQKFADSTSWVLPFNYLNGENVNAYALRHLARQHKMVDVAFQYQYQQKDPKYIRYFVNQMRSLNTALTNDKYEKIKDGNGVYEAFRSGYRVLNWLQIHTMFLGEDTYTDQDQLTTIATLLQHGAHLYATNEKFHAGNHQTRGVSALSMLAILLRDFKGTDLWYKRAMTRLGEHLSKEINEDGFQFERSVHYHMSDINNYFYVYQLAKISTIEISELWKEKLRTLFTTLVKIAYPDKTTPVLQDDTEIPWGEKNDISGAMTLGYLLFEDPQFGYFAKDRVKNNIYWFLQKRQLDLLSSIKQKKPTYESLSFPDTHYYIMREGWNKKDKMMIISAGLDAKKPDHQHGDMLGIQAMANGEVILPNYQVRYPLKDLKKFKNSMVKNVALVDNELQGKKWTSNKGGSGFGKFKELPNPKTIVWSSNNEFDLFSGSHDGFSNVKVTYSRQVIYVKNDFWIVKDNFLSSTPHRYKQVWQGHYTTEEGPALIRSTFSNASGCDIFQLGDVDTIVNSGARGKQWSIVSSKSGEKDFNFITVIYPYNGSSNRINEEDKNPMIKGWKTNDSPFYTEGNNVYSFSLEEKSYLFNVKKIIINQVELDFSSLADIYVQVKNNKVSVHSIGYQESEVKISGSNKNLLNDNAIGNTFIFHPGNVITFDTK